ncbi:MAG: hypothetical protein A3F33_00585 [Candidatus Woykebacteria bacterium RIFCSPHIGHO2_12_FULL_43_10]|nr:MAG: hypothetical protein A3F33_00585 [Candidatus Woykebacteria bacterium RIFCSPHIGHO2_12_FULL_43_10]
MKITRFNLLVALVFLVGVGLRLYYFLTPDTKISMDEATYGVQAFHILKGERSVFFYNQPYTGTLSAYLAAMLFSIFGVSDVWLKTVPFIFSVLFLLTTYYLAWEVFKNKYICLISLLFISVTSPFWVNWTTRTGTGYPEMMVFGNLILILTLKIVFASLPKRQGLYFFLLGLCAGIGYWIQPAIIYYGLAAMTMIFLWKPTFFLLPTFYLVPLGFFLGAMPALIWNFQNSNLTNRSLFHKPFGVLGSIRDFFLLGLPVIIGVRKPFSETDFFTPLALVTEAIYGLAIGYSMFNRLKDTLSLGLGKLFASLIRLRSLKEYLKPQDILILNMLFVLVVFSLSSPFNQFVIEPRYISALYTSLPVLLAAFVCLMWNRVKILGVFLGGIVLANNVYGLYSVPPNKFLDQYKLDPIISYLGERGVKYVYGEFDFSYRLVFETQEDIIATPGDNLFGAHRYPEYIKKVQLAPITQKACVFRLTKGDNCANIFGPQTPETKMVEINGFRVITYEGI